MAQYSKIEMHAQPPTLKHPAALKIGGLQLATNLVLSPLAGYTNLPFRLVLREIGGVGLCTTDLVNARSLLERNAKALKLIETCAEDQPLAIQLFGNVPDEMAAAAQACEAHGAASVDINMGCPVRKVCGIGAGSAMMTEFSKTASLVERMVEKVNIPITCKMRLGWDHTNLTAPELARACEEAGAQAIAIHGRTRAQGFSGRVNLPGIRSVVEAVRSIPVVGNGDVTTPEAAKRMIEFTGCAGVGIGRGAFYNPWIFDSTWHYLQTDELRAEPTFEERVRVMTRHLHLMVEVFGEERGCLMFRKVGPWYAKRFGPASVFNKAIVQLKTSAHYDEILTQYITWRQRFLDADGNLLPRFAPKPYQPDFDETEASPPPPDTRDNDQPRAAQRTAIPVPKGPNEWW